MTTPVNNQPEARIQKARGISLGREEKTKMKAEFFQYMDENPIEVRPKQKKKLTPSPYKFYSLGIVIAVCVLYVALSESALPGNPMYAFKTNMNERIMQNLAVSPESSARISTKLLERRLDEAAKLGLDKESTEPEWQTVVTGIDRASKNLTSNVSEIAETDASLAASFYSEHMALLDAHETVFDGVKKKSGQRRIDTVIDEIHAQQESNVSVRTMIAAKLQEKEQADIEISIEESIAESEEILKDVKILIARETAENDIESVKLLETAVDEAEGTLAQGKKELEKGDRVDALLLFEEANKILSETIVIIDAENQLNIDIPGTRSATTTPTS